MKEKCDILKTVYSQTRISAAVGKAYLYQYPKRRQSHDTKIIMSICIKQSQLNFNINNK